MLCIIVCQSLCVVVRGVCVSFFVQAEDGIRDLVRSRGLGDVYKRQPIGLRRYRVHGKQNTGGKHPKKDCPGYDLLSVISLSLIHI